MHFKETPIHGAWIIEYAAIRDQRGYFARVLDADEFARRGLTVPTCQWSVSWNAKRGTLRGLHYQAAPHEEVKVIRCTRGAVYDVLLDLRTGKWWSVELGAGGGEILYVPAGVAHGFQTLVDDTELSYFISVPYAPESARGVRWNDPALAIEWPIAEPILSERDRSFPDYR